MSYSVQPPRPQPTRLPRPQDSPDKNTGVGCHFLLQGMKVKSESEFVQLCPTLRDPMNCSLPGSSVHGIFQARVLEWVAIDHSTLGRSNTKNCTVSGSITLFLPIVKLFTFWNNIISFTRLETNHNYETSLMSNIKFCKFFSKRRKFIIYILELALSFQNFFSLC